MYFCERTRRNAVSEDFSQKDANRNGSSACVVSPPRLLDVYTRIRAIYKHETNSQTTVYYKYSRNTQRTTCNELINFSAHDIQKSALKQTIMLYSYTFYQKKNMC
jgi:hypothetical protein